MMALPKSWLDLAERKEVKKSSRSQDGYWWFSDVSSFSRCTRHTLGVVEANLEENYKTLKNLDKNMQEVKQKYQISPKWMLKSK